MEGAGASLREILVSMTAVHDAREFLLKNTREIINLCGKSIIAIHSMDMKAAAADLKDANKLLKEYKKKSRVEVRKYLIIAEQEFVEASALYAIARGRQIPSKDSLRVSDEAYVLGLLDCVGELKRFVLDKIRRNSLKEALGAFKIMEDLFSLLYPFASLDKVIKETRKKLDVDRMLVENTRAVITEEIRRRDFVDSIVSAMNNRSF